MRILILLQMLTQTTTTTASTRTRRQSRACMKSHLTTVGPIPSHSAEQALSRVTELLSALVFHEEDDQKSKEHFYLTEWTLLQ